MAGELQGLRPLRHGTAGCPGAPRIRWFVIMQERAGFQEGSSPFLHDHRESAALAPLRGEAQADHQQDEALDQVAALAA